MAVAWLNTNTDSVASNATSMSVAMSVTNSGANRAAVVHLNAESSAGTPAISGNVTYNSVNMTSAGAASVTGNTLVATYALPAPATGSNTLAWAVSGGACQSLVCDLIAYNGADQTTPIRAGSYNSSTDSTSSATKALTITSQSGDMTTTVVSTASGANSLSSTSQTQRNIDNSVNTSYGSDDASGAATVTHTWTWGGAVANHCICGFSIAAAGGADVPTAQICI